MFKTETPALQKYSRYVDNNNGYLQMRFPVFYWIFIVGFPVLSLSGLLRGREICGLQTMTQCVIMRHVLGALAQLVARNVRNVEVRGSNPLCSTRKTPGL